MDFSMVILCIYKTRDSNFQTFVDIFENLVLCNEKDF